ncbi:hypothetical protein E4U14_001102 [Claviceps sp. LM454 group G7]|nr:hypothetical protein E4U14_001102 [Claviceps sp. LM454 group G7]
MEGNGAANGARTGAEFVQFQPQDIDRRDRNSVTGEPVGPRTHLLSAYVARNLDQGRPPGATIAERVIQVPAIPRWPETSPGGIAHVIHTAGLPEEDAKSPWLVIQYANRLSTAGVNKTKSAILGNTLVTIRKSVCSGIYHCKHLAPTLLQPSIYTNLDAYWAELKRVRMRTTQNVQTQLKQEAISWAWAIRKDYEEKKACSKASGGQGVSCVPKVHTNPAPEGSRAELWVACENASEGGRSSRANKHQKQWIPARFDDFLTQIRDILNLNTQVFTCEADCHVVDGIMRKAKTCGK